MPPRDDTAAPVSSAAPQGSRPSPSRRSILRGAAGAGAAGLALTTLAGTPALAASRPHAAGNPEHVPDHIADGEAVVVHVRNVRSGELDVYRGTSHVRVIDRGLAAQLAKASHPRGTA